MNNKTTLSKDDIDTICIHLNAFKENLCNQGRYCEAEEYQQLIDKVQNLSKEKTIFLDKETKEDKISRKLIRKLVRNIFRKAVYIDTMMEFEDQKNPDSAIALSQDELKEILIMLSQADYLKDYLKENNIPYTDSKKCTKLNCPFQFDVISDNCDEKECLWRTE